MDDGLSDGRDSIFLHTSINLTAVNGTLQIRIDESLDSDDYECLMTLDIAKAKHLHEKLGPLIELMRRQLRGET